MLVDILKHVCIYEYTHVPGTLFYLFSTLPDPPFCRRPFPLIRYFPMFDVGGAKQRGIYLARRHTWLLYTDLLASNARYMLCCCAGSCDTNGYCSVGEDPFSESLGQRNSCVCVGLCLEHLPGTVHDDMGVACPLVQCSAPTV